MSNGRLMDINVYLYLTLMMRFELVLYGLLMGMWFGVLLVTEFDA